jgi:glycine cleavage system aminomethyltransferase T
VTLRDGTPLTDSHGRRSYVTSTGAGPSIGKYIVLTYLPPEHANEGEQLAVEYMAELLPATVEIVGSKPPFDPENERIRA